jgi:hypothetical protein
VGKLAGLRRVVGPSRAIHRQCAVLDGGANAIGKRVRIGDAIGAPVADDTRQSSGHSDVLSPTDCTGTPAR